jgi:hypothetical protein
MHCPIIYLYTTTTYVHSGFERMRFVTCTHENNASFHGTSVIASLNILDINQDKIHRAFPSVRHNFTFASPPPPSPSPPTDGTSTSPSSLPVPTHTVVPQNASHQCTPMISGTRLLVGFIRYFKENASQSSKYIRTRLHKRHLCSFRSKSNPDV